LTVASNRIFLELISIRWNYFLVSSSKPPADRGGGGGCVETLREGGDASGPPHGFAAVTTAGIFSTCVDNVF
jgi:hypothetical protein